MFLNFTELKIWNHYTVSYTKAYSTSCTK